MPLSLQQLRFIKRHSELVEQTATDYAEITLVYFRPRWKQLKISTRVNIPRDESVTEESNAEKDSGYATKTNLE